MSNPTIDLSKDLEAWYDFAPRYYDNQRNSIQDKSGYGRNIRAVGGPTVGVEGPNSFEATSFDGVDDGFNGPDSYSIPSSEPWSAFVLFKYESNFRNTILNLSSGDEGDYAQLNTRASNSGTNQLRFMYKNKNGDTKTIRFSDDKDIPFGETIPLVIRYDGEVAAVEFLGGRGRKRREHTVQFFSDVRINSIGFSSSSGFVETTISTVALWSRNITNVEIEYLFTIMTGPQRANL